MRASLQKFIKTIIRVKVLLVLFSAPDSFPTFCCYELCVLNNCYISQHCGEILRKHRNSKSFLRISSPRLGTTGTNV